MNYYEPSTPTGLNNIMIMGTYRQIFYHIIFGTKNREATISESHESELYKYIWGVINEQKSMLYRINSMPDHLHIFSDLHPSICLSDFVKNIKVASNIWMKNSGKFPIFSGWSRLRRDSFNLFNSGKGNDHWVY